MAGQQILVLLIEVRILAREVFTIPGKLTVEAGDEWQVMKDGV